MPPENWENAWDPNFDADEELEDLEHDKEDDSCFDPDCEGHLDDDDICDQCGLDINQLPGGDEYDEEVVNVEECPPTPSITKANDGKPISADNVLDFHFFIQNDDQPGIGGRGICSFEKNFFRRLQRFQNKYNQ